MKTCCKKIITAKKSVYILHPAPWTWQVKLTPASSASQWMWTVLSIRVTTTMQGQHRSWGSQPILSALSVLTSEWEELWAHSGQYKSHDTGSSFFKNFIRLKSLHFTRAYWYKHDGYFYKPSSAVHMETQPYQCWLEDQLEDLVIFSSLLLLNMRLSPTLDQISTARNKEGSPSLYITCFSAVVPTS